MTDTPIYQSCMTLAHRLADASGEVLMRHFRGGGPVTNKAADNRTGERFDPVTSADRDAEAIMRKMIADHHPDHGIIGEEGGATPGSSSAFWILDPLDGTRSFILGLPTWGTLIGLNDGKKTVLGLMSQPFAGDRFEGSPDGSFLHRGGAKTPIRVRPCSALSEAVMASTSPDMFSLPAEKTAFGKLNDRVLYRHFGGDCYLYCLLAMGLVDLVVESDLAIYDIQPLIPIVEGAGGVVTNWRGAAVEGGGQVIAAGDRAIHEAAVALLSDAAG